MWNYLAYRPLIFRPPTSDSAMPRPNILFIHSDQHRYDCVGVNGHDLLRTPNLDRMADEGMNFSHAFTPIPLCTPARISLLTGQWPTQHLAVANWHSEAPRPPETDLPTYSRIPARCRLHAHLHRQVACPSHKRGAGLRLSRVHRRRGTLQGSLWHMVSSAQPSTKTRFPTITGEAGRASHHVRGHGDGRARLTPTSRRNNPGSRGAQTKLSTAIRSMSSASEPWHIRWDPSEPHLPNIVPEPYFSMYPPTKFRPGPAFPIRYLANPTSRPSKSEPGKWMVGIGNNGRRSSAPTWAKSV